MHDGTGEEAPEGHNARDEREYQQRLRTRAPQDLLYPLRGREFGGGGERHANGDEDEKGIEQPFQVFTGIGFDVGTLGEGLTENEQAVNGGGNQHDADLHLPAHIRRAHKLGHQTPDDDTARKPDMKLIEHCRGLAGIHIHDERVARCLYRAICKANEKRRNDEAPKAPGSDSQHQAEHVREESHVHQIARPYLVVEQAAHHHGYGKTEESHRVDPTELGIGEAEGHVELFEDARPNGEGHGGDDEGHTAGQK